MILHKDGTLEGTPSEIAEYNKLHGNNAITLKINDYNTPANYVRGLLSAIGNSRAKEYNVTPVRVMSIEEVRKEIDDNYKEYMKGLVHQLYH